MSDPTHDPDQETTYAETREQQDDLEGLVDEKDGDFQDAVDAQREGDEPDEERNYKLT